MPNDEEREARESRELTSMIFRFENSFACIRVIRGQVCFLFYSCLLVFIRG